MGNASLERAVWAWSIVTSRCARFASVPDVEALVPWIDMFNHSPSATCYIDADRWGSFVGQ